jgi:hypothetical protein
MATTCNLEVLKKELEAFLASKEKEYDDLEKELIEEGFDSDKEAKLDRKLNRLEKKSRLTEKMLSLVKREMGIKY